MPCPIIFMWLASFVDSLVQHCSICLPLSPLCLNPVAASASIKIWSDPLHCKLCGYPRPKPRICPPFSPLCLNPGCFGLSSSPSSRSGLVRSRGRYGRSDLGSHPPPRKWKLRRWRASAKKGGPVIKEPEMDRHMLRRRRKTKPSNVSSKLSL